MAIKGKHGGLKDKKISTEKRFTKRFSKNQEKLYPKTFISNHSSQNDTVILEKSPKTKNGKFSFFVNNWLFVELRVAFMCIWAELTFFNSRLILDFFLFENSNFRIVGKNLGFNQTCSCPSVQYFRMLFSDDITIFWYEN